MTDLGMIYPRRKATLDHATSKVSTAHAVTAILGEEAFDNIIYTTTMMSGQTSGR